MVECSAYYEAYRHNLEGLQELDETNLPFQRYLLNNDVQQFSAPGYLQKNTEFDFGPLLQKKTNRKHPVQVLNTNSWPEAQELGLDASQYDALKLALTHEFAILQGPPGTGKTFIGLKIAELLLHNFDIWGQIIHRAAAQRRGFSPILLVCYTNHALDQFLEGVLSFAKKENGSVVRIGSRSTSENPELQKCLLKNLRHDKDMREHISRDAIDAKSALLEQLKGQENYLAVLGSSVSSVRNRILPFNQLLGMMLPCHANAFAQLKGEKNWILHWLLGTDLSVQQDIHMTEQWDEGMETSFREHEVDQAAANDEDEEAQMIQNERRLDDSEEDQTSLGKLSKQMLERTDNKIRYSFDNQPDAGGWEMKLSKAKINKIVNRELQKEECMSEKEENEVADIWALPVKLRWRLYKLWTGRYYKDCAYRMQQEIERFNQTAKRMAEFRDEIDYGILNNAKVIAMTTTGAAKYRHLLRRIAPRIVIVEEAAEVLEAHIVTSLTVDCQHLILIGDHQQLRPKPTVYKLAKKYNLDVSLFERMVISNMHSESLLIQHRMRPEIVKLIVPHIYSSLQNHEMVLKYDNIKGVGENLFFIEHSEAETSTFDTRSKTNLHEAEFVVAACKYLIQQGYSEEQITILTTYTGQMFEIRKRTRDCPVCSKVRVTPVDNYQGEENDIILLSLVRSNDEGKLGFTKTANRICVALSRAKKGFYVIGNMKQFKKGSRIWTNILADLEKDQKVGAGLPLFCQNHPDTKIEVKSVSDFQNVPEGGCTRPCDYRLKCGHVCIKKCHPTDPEHKGYQCEKPCIKELCELGHICPKKCFKECGPCRELVQKTISKCHHNQMVPCRMPQEEFICQTPCPKVFACGHNCPRKCGEKCIDMKDCQEVVKDREWPCLHKHSVACRLTPDNYPCPTTVEKTLPCGHVTQVECNKDATSVSCLESVEMKLCERGCKNSFKCYMKVQVLKQGCQILHKKKCSRNKNHTFLVKCFEYEKRNDCTDICGILLSCGHSCQGKCSECHESDGHKPCAMKCQRALPCGHICSGKCGNGCPPCKEPCVTGCAHNMCKKQCGAPCVLCTSHCNWNCEHKTCTMSCGIECRRTPCNNHCPLPLSCQHRCPGFCGEPCPQQCVVCQADFYQPMLRSLEISPSPVLRYVVLFPCRHAIPSSFMDTWVNKYQDKRGNGDRELQQFRCPLCSSSVNWCPRYQNCVRESRADLELVKAAMNDGHGFEMCLSKIDCGLELLHRYREIMELELNNGRNYTRRCFGCLSLLGETADILKQVTYKQETNKETTKAAKLEVHGLEERSKQLRNEVEVLLSNDYEDDNNLDLVCVGIQMLFMLSHVKYMSTYIRDFHKKETLRILDEHLSAEMEVRNDSKSYRSKKRCLLAVHQQLLLEIPLRLRNGIVNYIQHSEGHFKRRINLCLQSKWIICNNGHALTVGKDKCLDDVQNSCQMCYNLNHPDPELGDIQENEAENDLLQQRLRTIAQHNRGHRGGYRGRGFQLRRDFNWLGLEDDD